MKLSTSAHVDTFARDNLPAPAQWPTMEFTTELLQYPDRLNAATAIIDIPAATWPDRPALRTPDGVEWTFAEVLARANQIAWTLTEMGLVPGNRVLLRSPNTPWAVVAWLGILKSGGIPVTTFSALRARDLTPIVEKTLPAIALVDHRFVDDVELIRDSVAHDLRIVAMGGPGESDLVARAAHMPPTFANVETAADDVALFCPTSGTTGDPKICAHFHRDVLSIDNTFGVHILALQPDDIVACSAPLAFTFGLGMLVVFPFRAGASALLLESATPSELADAVAEHAVTVLATAPTAYRAILTGGKVDRLGGLRAAVSAGEHIPQQVWEQIRDRLGLEVIDGIGGTELLHIFISSAGRDIRAGATGKPLPGYRAAILGTDGQALPDGQEGRLAVIGPVGCRYLADSRQNQFVLNGWNLTGDTFVRDKDGYYFYQARTDNMIVSSGYNIGGPEVEAALNEHIDVAESAVVGAPDPDRGLVVCAFVVLRDGVTGDESKARELQDFVKQTLAPYKYPRAIRFIDALPRNISGKLQHRVLVRLLHDEQSVSAGSEAGGQS